jgi:hypothetical protein
MFRVVVAAGLALIVAGSSFAVTEDSPKYTIKEVMKKVHSRNGLLNKIKSGRASDAEKAQLVEYYEAMVLNKPEKGDPASYKKLADALVVAAKSLQKGDKDAMAKLNRAANCMTCHNAHK